MFTHRQLYVEISWNPIFNPIENRTGAVLKKYKLCIISHLLRLPVPLPWPTHSPWWGSQILTPTLAVLSSYLCGFSTCDNLYWILWYYLRLCYYVMCHIQWTGVWGAGEVCQSSNMAWEIDDIIYSNSACSDILKQNVLPLFVAYVKMLHKIAEFELSFTRSCTTQIKSPHSPHNPHICSALSLSLGASHLL